MTNPETYFENHRPDWMRQAPERAITETETQLLDAICGLLLEQRAVSGEGIHEEIEQDLTKEHIMAVVDRHLEE